MASVSSPATAMDEVGTVIEERRQELRIQVDVATACDSCILSSNCYANEGKLWVPKKKGIKVGDRVRLGSVDGSVLKISALVYGLPLVSLISGILTGYLLFFHAFADDARILLSALSGGILFALSAVFISRQDKALKRRYTCGADIEKVSSG